MIFCLPPGFSPLSTLHGNPKSKPTGAGTAPWRQVGTPEIRIWEYGQMFGIFEFDECPSTLLHLHLEEGEEAKEEE